MNENIIKFKYEESKETAPLLASGLMAAPTPDGRVLLRFFSEFPTMQQTETWRTENGQLVERLETEGSDAQITRRIVSSVVMDQNTLTAVVAAINQQLSNMRKQGGGNDNGNGNGAMPPPGFRR